MIRYQPIGDTLMSLLTVADLDKTTLTVIYFDKSELHVPVEVVVKNRADYYGREGNRDGYNMEEAIDDSVGLFNSSSYEIEDWLFNNMDLDEYIEESVWEKKNPHADYEDEIYQDRETRYS